MACGGRDLTEEDLLPLCSESDEVHMNLAAIKLADPYAKEVVGKAEEVVRYTFDEEKDRWEPTGIQGACFVYSRSAEPYHSVLFNDTLRSNANQLIEPITAATKVQNRTPFMLFNNGRGTLGFWFASPNDCDRIGDMITAYIDLLPSASSAEQSSPDAKIIKKTIAKTIDLGSSPAKLKSINALLHYPPDCLNFQPAFVATLLQRISQTTNFNTPRIPSKRTKLSNESLPAFGMKHEIMNMIEGHRVVVVCGETGCGKTTQVPQYILDYCGQKNRPCRIICTQPRRLATKQVALQVARELDERVGDTVGYQVRFEKQLRNTSSIIFMTR